MAKILVTGNPLDGLLIWGPFDDDHDIVSDVEAHLFDTEWWVAHLNDPAELFGGKEP